MSQSAQQHSSPSSSPSNSDSGSDRDEVQQDVFTRMHRSSSFTSVSNKQQQPQLQRRPSPAVAADTAYASDVSSSHPTYDATGPFNKYHPRQHSGLGLVTEGPYLFVFDVALSLYYPIRALILFVLGFVFSLVIDHLQTQHQLVEYPSNISQLWDTASWLPPTCGASAVLIGTIYPLGDYLWWGKRIPRSSRDWSSVMRYRQGF
ncbi:Insulin-induced protein 2 protein [Mortierella sp. GBA30]|nr:Insulin-induced protein 2 protein [Mortierella sp. GBA30]